jgi:hypothetical protein
VKYEITGSQISGSRRVNELRKMLVLWQEVSIDRVGRIENCPIKKLIGSWLPVDIGYV